MGTGKRVLLTAAGLAGLVLLLPLGRADTSGRTIQIGVANSLFRDTPPSLIHILSQPLKTLMESQTGLTGDLQLAGDASSLAQKLKEQKIQLGVFHGFEFAWAQQKNPDLRPLVIAVCEHRLLHAHLIVQKDDPASTWDDLKGKVVALPRRSREHCHLYLARRCPGSSPAQFFSRVTAPATPEDALDDVVDGTAQAAIVDRCALDKFQADKPGRCKRLRVLRQSEAFPAAVVAYQAGTLDEATLQRFRAGMVGADKTSRGKELLKMCRITNFEDVPADYAQLLLDIARAYPAAAPSR